MNVVFRIINVAALLIAVTTVTVYGAPAKSFVATPAQAEKMIKSGAVDLILDVRTMEEYKGPLGRLNGAQLIPVQQLKSRVDALKPFKNKTILLYCHSGGRSNHASRILAKKGFTSLIDLKGGIVAWKKAGLKTVK